MSIIGHKGIQVLSNINSSDDLPEIADVESEAVWYIESGDLAPDYIAPSFWDGEQFNEWISLVDGEFLVGIPDEQDLHSRYDFSEYDSSTTSNIPDLSDNEFDLVNGSISGYTALNGIQAADFNLDALASDTYPDTTAATVHMAVEIDYSDWSAGDNLIVLSSDSDNSDRNTIQNRDSLEWRILHNDFEDGTANGDAQVVFTYRYDPAGASNFRENGTEIVSISDSDDQQAVLSAIGADNDGGIGDGITLTVGEWLKYPEYRSDEETQEAESYLSSKWSI